MRQQQAIQPPGTSLQGSSLRTRPRLSGACSGERRSKAQQVVGNHGVLLRSVLQRKLALGAQNDQFEQEAQRVADQVMRMSGNAQNSNIQVPASNRTLQRKCSCGGTPGPTGECDKCRKKRLNLQRRAGSLQESTGVPPIVHEVLRSPGQPLDSATRAFMEPRFGHDFSAVRVHIVSKAAESARMVNALAYTVGQNVVFGAGQYQPSSIEGRRLLAHELTHVVQQSCAGTAAPLQLGTERGQSEAEAHVFTDAIANEQSAQPNSPLPVGLSPHRLTPHQTIQRVSFGDDGDLSPSLKAIVQAAAEMVERLIMVRDFEQQWDAFWKRFGKTITPQPTLEVYRAAVKGRVVHDMDSSKDQRVTNFLKGEAGFPLERQTAAISFIGSRDSYMRRFAIQQGVDSVASLLLHESWHGAGIGMGLFEAFEIAFHDFETAAGYPLMMGGGGIESVKQKRRGDTGVDVTIVYSLHKIGKDPLPSRIELQVAQGDSATVVHQRPLPRKVGRNTVLWQAENPGWNSTSLRIRNVDENSLMAAERIETNPRCVLGVSAIHCEDD